MSSWDVVGKNQEVGNFYVGKLKKIENTKVGKHLKLLG